MTRSLNDYAWRQVLPLPFDQVRERVIQALKEEGFGVLTEIDVQATLKQKLDAEFRRYAILGACNPPLAHEALQEELEIGLLLPCNLIVYESQDACVVSIIDPVAMLGLVENPGLAAVAEEAQSRLYRVYQALSA